MRTIFISNSKTERVVYHVLFWVLIIVVGDTIYSLMYDKEITTKLLLNTIYYTPTDILGVYITIYVLFPMFLYKKKYFYFSLSFLIFISILLFAITLPLQFNGFLKFYGEQYIENGNTPGIDCFMKKHFLSALTSKLMIIGIASAIILTKKWVSSQKKQQILENEKLEIALKLKESELKFLKSQINPHFLFNALNNLYSLTLEKSENAPETVLKISALLDYMLYDCNVAFIDLDKEIDSLINYIDLQKMRYSKNADIEFNITGDSCNTKVAPLIFLPFIENSFKHGLTKNMGKGSVSIDIKVEGDMLYFETKNTMPENIPESSTSGIGIKNVKKRLELQYKDKYNLDINTKDNLFSVKLKIIMI